MSGVFPSIFIFLHLPCLVFSLFKNLFLCHFGSVILVGYLKKEWGGSITQTLISFDLNSSRFLTFSPVYTCSFVSFLTVPVLGFLELVVLYLLCFSWRKQMLSLLFPATCCSAVELAPSVCRSVLRASTLLSSWEVWEALNHPATYHFLQLSPQQIRGLSLQDSVMAAHSFKAQEWVGMCFLPPPHPLARTDISLLSSCSGFHLLQGLLVRLFPHLLSRVECWRTRHCTDPGN